MDDFTETSSQSWFGRIGESIKGVAIGFLFIIGSIILLWWNEGRAVTTAKSLKEGAAVVVSAAPQPIDAGNQGKLVHVSGNATNSEALSDPMFMVACSNALRVKRDVQMFQWKEEKHSDTQKKLGGGSETVTTYSYSTGWDPKVINSSQFKQPQGHTNPAAMVAGTDTFFAKNATLGAFKLPSSILVKMPGDAPLPATEADLAKLPPDLKAKAKTSGGAFYLGKDSNAPEIGDQKISFQVINPGTFSIVARQIGDTFEPYRAKAGGEIQLVSSGEVSADAMFKEEGKVNSILTWLLRLGGFVLMSLGIGMMISPIVVFADVIPFIGSIFGAGVFIAAVGLGLIGSLVVIAVAWIAVRPVLGIALLAGAAACLVLAFRHGSQKLAARKISKAAA